MKTKVIIFDLWNTLGTKNMGVSDTLSTKFNIPKTFDLLVKYETAIQIQAWETREAMAQNFLKSFALEITEDNITFVIDTIELGINKATMFDGMKELLIELKKDYKLALLSNTTIFETKVIRRWQVEDIFDALVYSWQLQSIKPARKNFEATAKMLNVKLEECLFIDDSAINIQLAKEYGLKTIRFESVEKLKELLN